jgi:hypothetical protein
MSSRKWSGQQTYLVIYLIALLFSNLGGFTSFGFIGYSSNELWVTVKTIDRIALMNEAVVMPVSVIPFLPRLFPLDPSTSTNTK